MRVMNIGKLNKRVTFLRKDDTPNILNQQSKDYVEIATVWGSCYPARSREYYEIQKLQEEVTWKIYVRFPKSFEVRADMYIRCEGKLFEIQSVIDVDYSHKMLDIDAVEKINKTE